MKWQILSMTTKQAGLSLRRICQADYQHFVTLPSIHFSGISPDLA
jgi:hypothetical protein